jgi:hypothetical protein
VLTLEGQTCSLGRTFTKMSSDMTFALDFGVSENSERLATRRSKSRRIENVAFIWHGRWRHLFVFLDEFVQRIAVSLSNGPLLLRQVWDFLQQVQNTIACGFELSELRSNMHRTFHTRHPVRTGSPGWVATKGPISQIVKDGRLSFNGCMRINEHPNQARVFVRSGYRLC